MKRSPKGFAANLLLALNLFLIFLLLFESKLVVPNWLQPVGRLHPMFLHFPLVLLMLALVMEFFRFKTVNRNQEYYESFTSNLMLIGALSAVATAITGLFLSKEEGYSGDTLQWHKWTGSGIVFLASALYGMRNAKWYKAPLARAGAILAILCLIGAGHYGASITHGDNFVLAPLTSAEAVAVPFEQAKIFDHVVWPILNNKCVGCHNAKKMKGNLKLTDSASIAKGGRTGKMFIAGNPAQSLFLRRIHLPLDAKKHMPPAGNTQLTPEEIRLLSLWIKGDADFSRKIVELPASDSLRLFSSVLFNPASGAGEKFDFPAADEDVISDLNNDYRDVIPLARESPALAVSLFTKKAYTANNLAELNKVKKQIVSLNLNKMPVKDSELKLIGQFENLRKLDLNFTDITGEGLKELTGLKHLRTLSISGTNITYEALSSIIRAFASLKTIAVWQTGLTVPQIEQLQKQNKEIHFIAGFKDDGSDPIKLNVPQVNNNSMIFNEPIPLQLVHPIKGVEIRYTMDGSEPDSIRSPLFNSHILTASASINARAFKKGWFSSDAVTFDFYKTTHKPDSVRLELPLNSVHQADGPKSFFDEKLGTFNANSPAWANNWAGFRRNDMELVSLFSKPVQMGSVALRIMVEPETGILPPAVIEIWGGSSDANMKLLSVTRPKLPGKDSKHVLTTVESTFKPQSIACLKIIAKPVKKIPKGYKSEGQTGLILIDEIFLN